ncbi:GGDEF domain-containing protein [Vibrio aquaticus]|uniref:diguanylate cyclase n=1 Tax=Vibrio aquaticus TaxID=2496559 RepID=A0A3S0P881_9VIBR|nr:GGDEF domain-containing protein [Vibrio aquaticus]RTZ17486.1 GGDEF domain-containing protein [Vibrio aquaticus]
MSIVALQKIQALFAQIQLYHGVEGVAYLEESVSAICHQYDFVLPPAHEHFLLGMKFDRLDQLDKAIEHYQTCLSFCTSKDELLSLHVYIVLGSIYADREDYQRAHRIYRRVLDKVHLLDDNYLAFAYTNISDFYLCLKQYDSALQLAMLGEQSGRVIGNYVNQAICLLNMGYALGHLSRAQEALVYLEQSREIARSIKNQRIEAIAHGYFAQVMSLCDQYPPTQVISHFEQAEALYLSVHDKHNRQENLVYFGAYLEKIEQDERSLEICHSVESEIDPESSFGFFEVLHTTLIKLAKKQGRYDDLIRLQSRYITATQSAFSKAQQRENDAILNTVEQATVEQERVMLAQMEERIGVITEIGQYIATTDNLKENLPFIYDMIGSIFPAEEFGIALYNEANQILSYDYFYDDDGFVESTMVDCAKEHSIGSYVVQNNTTVYLNRIVEESFDSMVPKEYRQDKDNVYYDDSKPVQSILLTPITLKNRVLGVLSIQHSRADQYQQYHRSLFEKLASFIAIALEHHVQRHKLHQANKQLEIMSQTDPLTKLYNRYQLDSIGPELTHTAAQHHHNCAVVMIDIDYYKGYNDFHGHLMGDRALTQVAKQMKTVFSSNDDHLFRYGGDEFLILCYNQSDKEIESKLSALQESIKTLKLTNPLSQCNQYLTLTMGGANYTQVESRYMAFDLLCNLADKELYKAKQRGRNTFQMVSRTLHSNIT